MEMKQTAGLPQSDYVITMIQAGKESQIMDNKLKYAIHVIHHTYSA